ncbi:MAG TPA: DUF6285 domain-containing protein [Acidimicrobiales bacterium]|jgi:hypothetical protein|nr:DUF6285 domain-containing protein [Acidimicrobiales bacterium]
MKYRPDDAELLAAIAELLEDQVMAAVPPALQHQVRVAANLARIMERGHALEPDANERAESALAYLTGSDGDLAEQVRVLNERIEEGSFSHPAVWDALVGICRDDLAVAKPGYDAWEGE